MMDKLKRKKRKVTGEKSRRRIERKTDGQISKTLIYIHTKKTIAQVVVSP